MRFVIIQCAFSPLLPQWMIKIFQDEGVTLYRATHVKADGNAIDLFFHEYGLEKAKNFVRTRYPSAVFSDD